MSYQIKKCSNCGSENEINSTHCDTCGKLIDKNEIVEVFIDSDEEQNKIDNKSSKLSSKKDNKKEINIVKLLYLVFVLFVIGSFILIFSGTFDSEKTDVVTTQQMPNDEIHSGVDLSSIKKINELEVEVLENPEEYNKTLELAHLLNDSQLNEKAIFYYKKYLDKFPNKADVIVDMGVCYYESGQTDKAIEVMESAIKVDPKHQIAHLNLGIVNMSAGNHDKALEWWKKAVEINPNSQVGRRAKELLNQH